MKIVMCNLSNSVSKIIDNWKDSHAISIELKDADAYYAHTNPYASPPHETLEEHINLVLQYFETLVNVHDIDGIIDRLIKDYLKNVGIASQSLEKFIKKAFVLTVAYHDHGKINENFQASPEKMNNPHFKGKENNHNKISTFHSSLSSYIFISHLLDEVVKLFKDKKEQRCAIAIILLLSYPIYQHHSKYLFNDFWDKFIRESEKANFLEAYLKFFKTKIENPQINTILGKLNNLKNQKFTSAFEISFPLYQLIRLNFSLLTASDYLATNEYMSGIPVDDFGVLDNERVQELFSRVSQDEWINKSLGKVNFNKKTYDELDTLLLEEKPIEKSNAHLNLLRQHMATEAIRNIRKNIHQSIFYLEAPTGGGKTNISMLLALELLKANEQLNKVFYVFPFTTLIDQTYASIKENLNLKDREITALHSKASFSTDTGKEDDVYGLKKKNEINRLFVNFPFGLISHIRFFDILKTNAKETNYLLHRLANSVVVIDELQAYNPAHWDKIMYFIEKYAHAYHIKFIVMSATLPKIGNLQIQGIDNNSIAYLLPNAKQDYFQNPNFSGRINFDFSLLPEKIELNVLAEKVVDESKKYSMIDGGKTKPKGSVFTIVEFIFKKSATMFKQEIESIHQGFFDEVFVLSGTILHHRRRYIINYLKRKEHREKRILLITTQVVEAGVDIDMDLGFKDTSLIDSEEQLAGRINRNVNKEHCKLFLFNYNKESIIHKQDLRFDLNRNMSIQEKSHILNTKDFDLLYQKVIDEKNKKNKDHNFAGINEYLEFINQLQFQSVNEEFKLIEQENFSCFIPMDIPVEVEGEVMGENELIFNKNDLSFLSTYDVFPNSENKISGEQVFDVYLGLIDSNQSYTNKKIALKQLQSILSKFTFSLFATEKVREKLTHFMDVEKSEYGYFYMSRWKDFYDEYSGIRETAFEDIDKVQFL